MNGAQMLLLALQTALDVILAGIAAAPITWACLAGGIIAFACAAYQVSEHRGWRASAWALIGVCLFAFYLAMAPHAAEAMTQ